MFYQIIKVGKEEIGLIWDNVSGKPQIESIYLPDPTQPLTNKIFKDFPDLKKAARKIPGGIAESIAKLYRGEKEMIDLSVLNWSRLSEFSAKVLKQTGKIPRGQVATYSGLAAKVGHPGAARAVGTALATNPFPIVIPCHRVIRADETPGQFGGGRNMKIQLLEKEGVVMNGSCISGF